jgi:putative alpha-1,2-mannosidase
VYGSVSTSQEYALADACIARLEARAGRTAKRDSFARRSIGYRRLFDSTARWGGRSASRGAFRPRAADGAWAYHSLIVDRSRVARRQGPGFVEGDEWDYLFNAPHDLDWIMRAAGTRESFAKRLDDYFASGAFDLSNEPTLGYPYLYARAGDPSRTQARVRALLDDVFLARPRDLPGDDDAGTLSAWIVWTALGLYPSDPCSDELVIGEPLFVHATITDAAGKALFHIARSSSPSGRQAAKGATSSVRPPASVRLSDIERGDTVHVEVSITPPPGPPVPTGGSPRR